jgi:hypothetical protein
MSLCIPVLSDFLRFGATNGVTNALPLGNIVRISIDSDAIIYERGSYIREL